MTYTITPCSLCLTASVVSRNVFQYSYDSTIENNRVLYSTFIELEKLDSPLYRFVSASHVPTLSRGWPIAYTHPTGCGVNVASKINSILLVHF